MEAQSHNNKVLFLGTISFIFHLSLQASVERCQKTVYYFPEKFRLKCLTAKVLNASRIALRCLVLYLHAMR